ncbi:hypothetical protein COCSADRAFT_33149 [Bipolaris sorokiniana ND90Pr]|uniref:AGC-kinase C-terminal domain-containing protein n=1 Tax=Cochliobolus sativus (strain ND90Pr / ATCC 201652) TaxID=665912 RepID=M2TG17_COCSN|nr:uncharacterized protein COCSADRAFT_33149 [Bipolaris sorokiniana ND90Pr]EMD68191.1 hypothetical protein COCSADRAFT_33149 [Bipolaris sorokiniana ND90Pr]
MAPSGTSMFSKFRPGHAKRNASSVASPEQAVSSPTSYPLPGPASQSTEYLSSPRFHQHQQHASLQAASSPVSPFPPKLPPIARVASKLDKSPSPSSSHYTSSQHSATTTDGSPSNVMAHDPTMLSPPQRSHDFPSPVHDQKPLSARSNTATSPLTSLHSLSETPSAISPSHYSMFSKSQPSLLSGISDKLTGSSKGTSIPTVAPPPPPQKSRSRLNLRKPMSLLMRRKSAQTLDPLADESLVTQRSPSNLPPMPDNYDPSIRGKIVHDFNAPRLNRNYSYNTSSEAAESQPEVARASPPKIDREHTPVFREHFDDDTSYEQSQAAIRAENLVNKDFLARNSVQFPPPEHSLLPPMPPKPSPVPPQPAPPNSSPPPRPSFQGMDGVNSVLSPVQESEDPSNVSADVTPRKKKSTKVTMPPTRSRATSVTDPSFQPAGLPAHFSSRASRFSFQISGGTDSAQEKLLEERHKAKEAEKKQARISTNSVEDEYDEYGMDDYDDMDGGFDEEIPMLGDEDEFTGGLGNQTLDSGINGVDFSSLSIQQNMNSPMNFALGQMQIPVDMNGNPIGFAMPGPMFQQNYMPTMTNLTGAPNATNTQLYGLGLSNSQSEGDSSSSVKPADALTQAVPASASQPVSNNLDLDDDMYFDDGLIGDQDVGATEFDESVFDDPDGPLFDRKVKLPAEGQSSTAQPRAYDVLDSETGYEADDDIVPQTPDKSAPSLAHKTSIAQQMAVPSFENLSAYHSALADAAVRAEAAGRFDRKASVDAGQPSSEIEEPSVNHSRPSLVPDDGRVSVDTTSFPLDDDVYGMSSGFVDDYDYSDFDSALEDDPIIAAANAEALAYDDEGFYGQEFGFYASAVGESPSAWGGFFGPSGVGRTVSGRNAVREPNLTPITERSEYSTRNSFISLNQFRDGQQPIASPALAQLARMSPYGGFFGQEEEDMSLDSLMKLRKGAFGASASSLPGSLSNSPRTSSPMGMQFVPRATTPAGNRMMEHPSSPVENPYFSNNNLSGHQPHEDGDYEEGDSSLMDAVNGAYESGSSSEDEAGGNGQMESPTLTSSDYNSLSSPTGHIVGNEAPLLPSISELYAQHNLSLVMSPISIPVTSPSHVSLPASPFPMALSSPFPPQPHTRPPNPPSIDTSLSSPTAGTTSMPGAPRRQSVVLSPISTSSPITPNGGSSSGGWNRGHSRKGSAADSVTYVREHDEAGEGRWVLERRRTAESGELELIGRKIVEGGRI